MGEDSRGWEGKISDFSEREKRSNRKMWKCRDQQSRDM